MSDLKPCPFCGSTDIYKTIEGGYLDSSVVIFCNSCKISVKLETNDQEGFNKITEKRAVEAWNMRIEPERKAGHWVKAERRGCISYADAYAECDHCHKVIFCAWDFDYCPRCGAKMEVDG